MLTLFIILSNSISSSELIYFTEICRHGARAPKVFMPWDNEVKWPDGAKNLISEGLRQHYLLGAYLRKRYIQDSGFLSPCYNSSELKVYSTSISRTLFSMQSQLLGLYPQQVSENSSISVPVILSHPKAAFRSPVIPIYMDLKTIEPMLLAEDYCENYKSHVKARRSGVGFFSLINSYPDVLFPVAVYHNSTKEKSVGHFMNTFESVISNSFMKYDFPSEFEDVWLDRAYELYGNIRKFLRYSNEYTQKLAGSAFLNELVSQFETKILNDTFVKATIYSAHDTTISNIFATLNISFTHQPPFAAILLFELHASSGKHFVRVLYNDVGIKLDCCETEMCEYENFKLFIEQRTFKNATEACELLSVFETKQFQGSIIIEEDEVKFSWFIPEIFFVVLGVIFVSVKKIR